LPLGRAHGVAAGGFHVVLSRRFCIGGVQVVQ
jgi:hypothetical protein